jgi:hypothetical protein
LYWKNFDGNLTKESGMTELLTECSKDELGDGKGKAVPVQAMEEWNLLYGGEKSASRFVRFTPGGRKSGTQ